MAETIAYLGPEGTYSHEAAHLFATRMNIDAELVPFPSFNTVFEAVDRGQCDYGVVPTENSLEGAVTSTLDNFAFNSDAVILGEQVLPIHHCLLTQADAPLSGVKKIASHAQGLAQCRRWIMNNMPGVETLTTSSTAESARLAAEDASVAGIANAYAAELHGVEVREANIEDHLGNETAFALIARPGTLTPFEGSKYKTSLALFLNADQPGALLMILSEFAFAGINLTKIQSRPTKQALGDYMFFVDLEGAESDPAVQTALNCLRLKLRNVKVLGSYPVD